MSEQILTTHDVEVCEVCQDHCEMSSIGILLICKECGSVKDAE